MGKEKDMLKTLIANTELIMKHLNIEKPNAKADNKEPKAPVKKQAAKKMPVKKAKK